MDFHPVCRKSLALVAVLGLFAAAPSWAQTTPQPAPQSAPQATTPSASKAGAQKSNEMGVWHHFGESTQAPSAAPRPSTGWHHFGETVNSPPAAPTIPSTRATGVNDNRDMELSMLQLVNRDRADPANYPETHGRAVPLRWNDQLAAVARAHCLDMLNQGYFSHVDPQGRSVAGRVEAAGLAWQEVGENIAIYPTVASAEAAFMNEPKFAKNHRGNILNPGFTEVGIGIVRSRDGNLYITQDFYAALEPRAAR